MGAVVGVGLAGGGVEEVVDLDRFGLPGRAPPGPAVLYPHRLRLVGIQVVPVRDGGETGA